MHATPHSTLVQASPGPSGVIAPDPHERANSLLLQALASSDRREADALRDEAVLLTLDLPEQVARRYRGRGIDHDDLVQVGRVGLVKAARGYRAGVGSGFVSYAMPTICGEVKRHFRDCGWAVRPPRRLQEVRALLGADEEQLTQSLRRCPTTEEMAEALGLDPRAVAHGCFDQAQPAHLDQVVMVDPASAVSPRNLLGEIEGEQHGLVAQGLGLTGVAGRQGLQE